MFWLDLWLFEMFGRLPHVVGASFWLCALSWMAQTSSNGNGVARPPLACGAEILGPATGTPLPIVDPPSDRAHSGQAMFVGPVALQSVVIGPVSLTPARIVPMAVGAEITGPRQGPRASTAEALMSAYSKVMDRGAIPIVTAVSSDEEVAEDGMQTPPHTFGKQKRKRLQMDIHQSGDELPEGWELGRSPPPAEGPQVSWEVPPARRDGPGRKAYTTGSLTKAAKTASSGKATDQRLMITSAINLPRVPGVPRGPTSMVAGYPAGQGCDRGCFGREACWTMVVLPGGRCDVR